MAGTSASMTVEATPAALIGIQEVRAGPQDPVGSGGAGEPAVVEGGEAAAAGDQVVGGADLDHAAVLDDGDLVGVDHGGEPVGDQDCGASLAQAPQGLLQARLGDD